MGACKSAFFSSFLTRTLSSFKGDSSGSAACPSGAWSWSSCPGKIANEIHLYQRRRFLSLDEEGKKAQLESSQMQPTQLSLELAANCTSFTDCASCSNQDDCGWCATTSACVQGNSVAPRASVCPAWQFFSCPGLAPSLVSLTVDDSRSSITLQWSLDMQIFDPATPCSSYLDAPLDTAASCVWISPRLFRYQRQPSSRVLTKIISHNRLTFPPYHAVSHFQWVC